MRTGIAEHPGRKQPFTVWFEGEVVYFSTTRAEAERILAHYHGVRSFVLGTKT